MEGLGWEILTAPRLSHQDLRHWDEVVLDDEFLRVDEVKRRRRLLWRQSIVIILCFLLVLGSDGGIRTHR